MSSLTTIPTMTRTFNGIQYRAVLKKRFMIIIDHSAQHGRVDVKTVSVSVTRFDGTDLFEFAENSSIEYSDEDKLYISKCRVKNASAKVPLDLLVTATIDGEQVTLASDKIYVLSHAKQSDQKAIDPTVPTQEIPPKVNFVDLVDEEEGLPSRVTIPFGPVSTIMTSQTGAPQKNTLQKRKRPESPVISPQKRKRCSGEMGRVPQSNNALDQSTASLPFRPSSNGRTSQYFKLSSRDGRKKRTKKVEDKTLPKGQLPALVGPNQMDVVSKSTEQAPAAVQGLTDGEPSHQEGTAPAYSFLPSVNLTIPKTLITVDPLIGVEYLAAVRHVERCFQLLIAQEPIRPEGTAQNVATGSPIQKKEKTITNGPTISSSPDLEYYGELEIADEDEQEADQDEPLDLNCPEDQTQ